MVMRPLGLAALLCLALPSFAGAQALKVSQSLDELEMAVGVDPYDPIAHYNLSLGYWSKKKYEKAEAELRRAVELDPRLAPAWLALAMVPLAQRGDLREEIAENDVPEDWRARVDEMDGQYRRAFLLDPLVDVRIMGAVRPRKSRFWKAPANAAIYDAFFRAFEEFEQGDYEAAYKRFDSMLGGGDRPTFLLWYRGLSAAQIGRLDEAVRDIEKLTTTLEEIEQGENVLHAPLRTNEYRYLLAYLEDRRGNTDRALELYRETLVQDVGLYMAHVRLAEIHEKRGNWEDALTERRRAIDANPEDPTLLTDLGRTLAQMESWDEAREVMHGAVEANPDDPRPWYYRGLLDLKMGDLVAAREAFQEFLRRAPSRCVNEIKDARARLQAIS